MKRKHLLGLSDVSRTEIEQILETAEAMSEILSRPIKKAPALRGKSVCTLFFEASTRTRASFEMAAKTLSADTSSLTVAASSVSKGETLKDTLLTLASMGAGCFVIRHSSSGAAELAASYSGKFGYDFHIINAGDGQHEHPTQGLLDLLTIQQHKGTIEGLNVTILGDLLHSRVARSDIHGLLTMGANLTLCGPETLLPREFESLGLKMTTDADAAVTNADVVMTLRLQNERMNGAYLPSVREFAALYGINAKRLKLAKNDAIVMHPGPINRGVEISDEVADCAQSVILNQVKNGVAIRMAVLYLLLGGEEN
ncbi:aspartate carbamoyltransferase [Abditibacterium utsteinense]|uniref:Aspartate carbamoyltransferase n=1 Tax=Abditibacterium utsteinense TaxID=1960156 RepID=A0A2S8SU17_9BACT|nr:aspartate carbamoyltransferase catalytic subunit [Abditibacterium utsteinense]PQV64280.1 aspartate carbamoyltransferase [Abditibacterium utsteinense]